MRAVLLDPPHESGKWSVDFNVKKWHTDEAKALGLPPYEIVYGERNILLTAGITRMLNLLIGAGGQAFTATYARLGVGNGSTAVTAGDTDLSAAAGAANRWFRPMDSTYPSVATNVVTFQGTWAAADGNFVWNEWGIDLGGAGTSTPSAVVGAPLLNRRVPGTNLGTKTGGSWTLQVTITIS